MPGLNNFNNTDQYMNWMVNSIAMQWTEMKIINATTDIEWMCVCGYLQHV